MEKNGAGKGNFTQYVIPIASIKTGVHYYEFIVDKNFFSHFEDSIIEKSRLEIKMELDKRTAVIELSFDIEGYIETQCDRCLEKMDLGIESNQQLLIKYSDTSEDDAEVSYIPVGSQEMDVSSYIYELAHLAIPIVKAHEDIDEDCPVDLEAFLEKEQEEESEPSIWDALKNIDSKPE